MGRGGRSSRPDSSQAVHNWGTLRGVENGLGEGRASAAYRADPQSGSFAVNIYHAISNFRPGAWSGEDVQMHHLQHLARMKLPIIRSCGHILGQHSVWQNSRPVEPSDLRLIKLAKVLPSPIRMRQIMIVSPNEWAEKLRGAASQMIVSLDDAIVEAVGCSWRFPPRVGIGDKVITQTCAIPMGEPLRND